MTKVIDFLREFGMSECILRASIHADMVADMTNWRAEWFGFSNHLLRGFLWALLGEICLFIANGILLKLRKPTQ